MIGDEVEVSILAVAGDKVRLGIEAPKSVPVFRKEVYLEILNERAERGEAQPGVTEAVDEALDRLKAGD
jgi:carbon storage regulator